MAQARGNSNHSLGPGNMEASEKILYVYDRRSGNNPEVIVNLADVKTFNQFDTKLRTVFNIPPNEKFVACTTNREAITQDDLYDQIDDGETLYLLTNINQELTAPTQQLVHYLPHYDTLVKSGIYEYYASEGQNPLPYAFAELIDNSLAATVSNSGTRNIELRLNLEDAEKSTIFVIDNGAGMSSRQLNNWAIYRLSKFIRKDKVIRSRQNAQEEKAYKLSEPIPRSLNSEISYFGVGGKQAMFFIGHSTRMITKTKDSCDVHELRISKEEFERKEKTRQAVYSGFIHNRQPGDISHLGPEDEHLRKVIEEEKSKTSFTCVVVQGISQEQTNYCKHNFKQICRQLAHIYHYYIHGAHGNQIKESSTTPSPFCNINIEIKCCIKGMNVRTVKLRDIDDDLQTQFIRSAENSFEFKAVVMDGAGIVEGVMRYHPFLYDQETYPRDSNEVSMLDFEDELEYIIPERPARGRRPIFECYWNGRLIPYTTIDEFDWCAPPKKVKSVPLDCYNRVSGVLWTNEKFQVSTNKLTFIDLENRLRDKTTVFCRVVKGQERRANIDKQFTEWLKECHETCDKQIKFCNFQKIINRTDVPRNKHHPWAVYHSIEWDGKTYKKGQLVRMQRTVPIIYGTISRFLLFSDYDNDIFATGGDIEIIQEPRSLYGETKVLPLAKLDRAALEVVIKRALEDEEEKLPEKLIVSWPEGDELFPNEKMPAGKTIGAIKVEISNRRGDLIQKLPGTTQKKLLIELKVIWHSPSGDQAIASHICAHAKNWPYWFRKMENLRNLGPHTLSLQTVINEPEQSGKAAKNLPSYKIKFTVVEAAPDRFTVGLLDGPFRIGMPFQIPLEFQDKFGNPTKPTNKSKPELSANGLKLTYECVQVKGRSLLIKGIVAKGAVETNAGKNFTLTVKISELVEMSQNLKIRMLPGPPYKLLVQPHDDEIQIENGAAPSFQVEVQDIAGNYTSNPRLIAICRFFGSDINLPDYMADCSASGQAVLTGQPIILKNAKTSAVIKARIEIQGHPRIEAIEKSLKILPSSRAAILQLSYKSEAGEQVPIEAEEEIICEAGSTLKNLEFAVLNEGGSELELSSFQLSKLKVNWVPKMDKSFILMKHLPDINVPTSTKESKYCNISIGEDVDFGFTIKVIPGKAASLKCAFSSSNKIRLGELLESDIFVSVSDTFGNNIKKLTSSDLADLEVTGEDLVTDNIVRSLGQNEGFVIKGVSFETKHLGMRELCVFWKGISDYIRVHVVAGLPAKMIIPDYDVTEPITICNNKTLDLPLIVQLNDEADNPCEDSNIKIQLVVDEGLKLTPVPQQMKTDSHGRVNFGKLTVSVKSSQIFRTCPGSLCEQNCRGIYSICPKAFCTRYLITGPVLKVHIPSDHSKAVALHVDYDKTVKHVVGDVIAEFRVKVIAEDGSVLDSVKPSEVSMKMLKTDNDWPNKLPQKAIVFAPNTNVKSDEVGLFTFRDHPTPEVAGVYNVVFIYEYGNTILNSSITAINVSPGRPMKLAPVQNLSTPTVSNTSKLNSRTLFKTLKLELRDAFGNSAGFNLQGILSLSVLNNSTVEEIPSLSGGVVEVVLQNGQATVQNLAIEENTAGVDGQEYILRCSTIIPSLPRNHSIPPYDISFLFYNDVKTQAAMASLSRERDLLLSEIKMYKQQIETSQNEKNELKMSLEVANQDEQKLKLELRNQGIPVFHLNSLEYVSKLIEKYAVEKQQICDLPRRKPGLYPAPKEPEVLGKIAHLAEVTGDDIAQVLSWHMSADMDCIITLTLSKAKDIFKKTNGSQQVLALDSLYRRNLPDWNKPLPHTKVRGHHYNPTGNPIYARNLFTFPKDPENCKLVFGMLLGDTIVLDTLDDATAYRQEIVKYTYCPTLLTRKGDRIRSNGKFGGQQNRAPPLEKLRGAIFGEPLPERHTVLISMIELLQSYHAAKCRREQAGKDLNDVDNEDRTCELRDKKSKCKASEERLRNVEQQLGMSANKSGNRTRAAANRSMSRRDDIDTPSGIFEDTSKMEIDHVMPGPSNFSGPSTGVLTRRSFLNVNSPSTLTRTRARRKMDSPIRSDESRKRRK